MIRKEGLIEVVVYYIYIYSMLLDYREVILALFLLTSYNAPTRSIKELL
jgi:hypothetical protein